MVEHQAKVIAIVGASSGIGAATAVLLAQHGSRLVLGARRRDRLDEVARSVRDAGGDVDIVTTDVRKREALEDLVGLAQRRFGRLDVLINSAGIGPVSRLEDLRVVDWEAMVAVNVTGMLYGIAAALPVFQAQGHGHFVHVVSTAAYKTAPGQTVYAATKTAARTLTEGLRQEVGPSIRVSMVSPGFVNTDFINGVPDPEMRAEMTTARDAFALDPASIAEAIDFAITRPESVDVNEIVVRPTAQK